MRSLILAFLVAPTALIAASAQAQSLSWPGKAPAPAHLSAGGQGGPTGGVRPRAPVADVRMVPTVTHASARVESPLRGLRPAPLLPLYGQASTLSAPLPAQSAVATASLPPPTARPSAAPAPQATGRDPMAPRADAPIFQMNGAASDRVSPATTPVSDDSLAPRPDAAVFQTAPAAPSPAPISGAGASARYYSLHRPTGRAPDAIPQPQPVYLDALPVELVDPPKSEDMAAPPEVTRVLRDANGRVIQDTMTGDDW